MSMEQRGEVGVVGLGAMGRNLALHAADEGFTVLVHDPWPQARAAWNAQQGGSPGAIDRLPDFVARLTRPRRVLLLLKAGAPTDVFLDVVQPLLEPGDVIADLGNANFRDTERRQRRCAEGGIQLLGVGISGGAEGARTGASFMGGGDAEAWSPMAPIFEALAARAEGVPCSQYFGPGGAGHYVKMVHNAIEYVEMQALSEAYLVLRELAGLSPKELAACFDDWNQGAGESFLTGLAAQVLRTRDDEGGALVDHVLDEAGQKGTGRWAVESALELGVAAPTLAEAVFARALSAQVSLRQTAAELVPGPLVAPGTDGLVDALGGALLATRISGFAQGFALLDAASRVYGWNIDLPAVAEVWRAGCILRGALLPVIASAFRRTPKPMDLLASPEIISLIETVQPAWRRVVSDASAAGLPVPAIASALAAYDALRTRRLGANLIAAQRDAFGAHGFRRTDRPGDFHADWSGR